MRCRTGILLVLLLLSISLIGCKTIVLHPIEKSDIVIMTKGVAYTPEKNGYFLSDQYMKEEMQAKVELKK